MERTARKLLALGLPLALAFAGPRAVGQEALRRLERTYDGREYSRAIELARELIERGESSGAASRILGHAYYELGRFGEARRAYGDAIGHGELALDVLLRAAELDEKAGRVLPALEILRLADAIEPDRRDVLLHLGAAAGALGLQEEAIAACERVLELFPLESDAAVRLANIRLERNEIEDALAGFELAFYLGQRSPDLAVTCGQLSWKLGEPEDAAAWFERALLLGARDSKELLLQKALVLRAAGGYESAAEAASRSLDVPATGAAAPELDSRARVLLGELAIRKGDEADAIAHWEEAARSGEPPVEVHSYLAARYFRQGDHQRALDELAKRLARNPAHAESLQLAARALIELGRADEARARLESYVAEKGLDDAARDLIKRLVEAAPPSG